MTRRVRSYLALACAGIGVLGGCPTRDTSEDPVTPDRPIPPPSTLVVTRTSMPAAYFKTQDSDAWVAHNFKLQASYARVLLVGEPPAKQILVAPPSLAPASQGATPHDVSAHFATIAEAVAASRAGDLIAIQPGTYAGFTLDSVEGAGDRAFTFIRGLGPPGSVVIDRAGRDTQWMIYLRAAHHVALDGLHLKGNGGGGPRAGIMLDGDFGRSGRMMGHVAVSGVLSSGHRDWGMHAVDTATVLVQDSIFTNSAQEHGLYVSDGSDDWVIRRNVFTGNFACGLQINLDPIASFEEVVKHIGMTGIIGASNKRSYAEAVLKRGNSEYGEHNFPDGRGVNFLIERNVSTNNGDRGGAAFNFAAMSDSLVQNNLLYDNRAGGIAQWDNGNPYDGENTNNQPKSPAEWVPARKPLFGCRNNLIRYNTILSDNPRAAIECRNGSWGCKIYGNVAIHGRGAGLRVTEDSIAELDARDNVFGTIQLDGPPELHSLATTLPAKGSRVDVTLQNAMKEFVAGSNERWLVPSDGWWRAGPKRPDFHPRPGSALFSGVSADVTLDVDLEGQPRKALRPGAFAAK